QRAPRSAARAGSTRNELAAMAAPVPTRTGAMAAVSVGGRVASRHAATLPGLIVPPAGEDRASMVVTCELPGGPGWRRTSGALSGGGGNPRPAAFGPVDVPPEGRPRILAGIGTPAGRERACRPGPGRAVQSRGHGQRG